LCGYNWKRETRICGVDGLTQNRQKQHENSNRIGGERRVDDAARIANALEKRGHVSMRVHGTSMLPWVRPGNIALIRQTSIENVRCGDIVLFRRDTHLFVHRIVEKRGLLDTTQLFSKGDAHPTSDGLVEEGQLLGRVVRIYKDGDGIDLDAPGQLALGLLMSKLSLHSRYWYPLAKFVAIVTRPMRRLIRPRRVAKLAVR
jgi:hypothetical protein